MVAEQQNAVRNLGTYAEQGTQVFGRLFSGHTSYRVNIEPAFGYRGSGGSKVGCAIARAQRKVIIFAFIRHRFGGGERVISAHISAESRAQSFYYAFYARNVVVCGYDKGNYHLPRVVVQNTYSAAVFQTFRHIRQVFKLLLYLAVIPVQVEELPCERLIAVYHGFVFVLRNIQPLIAAHYRIFVFTRLCVSEYLPAVEYLPNIEVLQIVYYYIFVFHAQFVRFFPFLSNYTT